MGTITDGFLTNIAKAMNNESFQIPDYLGVATDVVASIGTTDSTLSGEIGSRIEFSGSRSNNIVTLTAIRSSVSVIDQENGDTLNTSGAFGDSTGDTLFAGVIHNGITQTTNFDIEFQYEITYDR